jgi:hypothetical protein
MPAQAGIQAGIALVALGPRFRGNERMGYPFPMIGDKKHGEREAERRARRAAAALRENLKRRKAQERARRQGASTPHESARIVPDKPKV